MKLSDLIVTQSDIRSLQLIRTMTPLVRIGMVFDKHFIAEYHREGSDNSLIKLSRFPDGAVYIHDGHHRIVSKCLGGATELLECEYVLRDWNSYDAYLKPNFSAGWVTPFDPRLEVRKADFFEYKNNILKLEEADREAYINNNRCMYCEPREFHDPYALAKKIEGRL